MFLRAALAVVALLVTAAPAQAAWTWPVHGEVITPYRYGDDPYAAGQHRGIDIAAPVGGPVVAAAAGEVRFAGTAGSSGLTVSIRTADGAYDTSYLHLSEARVRSGEHVGAGDRLGSVGTTGSRSAERPHLHFGVREAGTKHAYHDPLAFLPAPPNAPSRPEPAPSPVPLPLTPEPGAIPARRAPAPRTSRPLPAARPELLPRPVAPEREGAARPAPAAGPDLGLVLACLGLVAAAAVLGLAGGDGREGARPVGQRLAARLSLRPGRG